ncbi:hypothetical protein [Gordonia insulae]|uniref:hypothetical protein n=1 Tax=Gordonia insulae TaxID=2420509 RepID=UPI000F5BC5E9|nr:hypothetical protein [Gordonia insulae]
MNQQETSPDRRSRLRCSAAGGVIALIVTACSPGTVVDIRDSAQITPRIVRPAGERAGESSCVDPATAAAGLTNRLQRILRTHDLDSPQSTPSMRPVAATSCSP